MAEPVISFVLETISTLLQNEAKFLLGVKERAVELEAKLKHLKRFLRDADSRKKDDQIHEWILEIKEIAYDAEDVLESYAFRAQSGGIIKRAVCFLTEGARLHQAGSEIETLIDRISKLQSELKSYGVTAIMEGEASHPAMLQQLRRTYSHVTEDFVGLEDDVEKLVQCLVAPVESTFPTVSIYGMGGIGKTTLAKRVYNNHQVRIHFDKLAWIYVSQQWNKRDLLQGILLKLIPSRRDEIAKWRDEELVRELFNVQKSSTCLVVLDDIWSINAWKSIQDAFPRGDQSGSKIMLTTRNKDVALHIGPNGFHHETRLLRDDECWELLKKKALTYRYDQANVNEWEELGKKMANRCQGLPLAAIVLGGILATKSTLDEWETVHKNIKYYLEKGKGLGENQGELQKILELSYSDLPYRLKPCFMYLAKYPEDDVIDAEELYHLWMAEGFVSMEDRMGDDDTMIEIAERYLGELAERCMVQVERRQFPHILRFEYCGLHDLMRDLCLSKSKEENFLTVIDHRSSNEKDEPVDSASTGSMRRLVINIGEASKHIIPKRKHVMRHLRALEVSADREDEEHSYSTAGSLINQSKMVRALVLRGITPCSSDSVPRQIIDALMLPKAICNLIHLRYLSLPESIFLILPSRLSKLKHLHSLDLSKLTTMRIPNVLWTMDNLRYLYLPFPKKFFSSFGRLRFRGLHRLEVLKNFSSQYCDAKDLKMLTNLQMLTIMNEVVVGDLTDFTEIVNCVCNTSSRLKYAFIHIGEFRDNGKEGEALLSRLFHSNKLTGLNLKQTYSSYLSNLPGPSSLSRSLANLTISQSELGEEFIEMLGKLPNLQSLHIYNTNLGKELVFGNQSFPQLRYLTLAGLTELEEWTVDEGAMPNLIVLRIFYCQRLEMIPDGLRFVTTLKELEINGMLDAFNERVQVVDGREGEDFHKICHVPTITIKSRPDH